MKDKKKKKKEKAKYYDDGRTIYDMSGTSRQNVILGGKSGDSRKKNRGTAREQMDTFVTTMRQMILPMLVVMGIITFAFGVLYLILKFGA